MIGELFYWVVNMSVVATLSGMVIWGLGHIRRVPARVTYCLWLIPLVRLTVPFGFDSPYSLMTLLSKISTVTSVRNVPVSAIGDAHVSSMNCIQLANGYFPISFTTNLLDTVFLIGGIIWITVCVCLLILTVISYRSHMSVLSRARHLRDNLFISEDVLSPTVFGIFRAKIVLPREYTEDELALVLRHENVHIRRKDNLWRMIALFVACVHWFNPAVWLFLKSFAEQAELSCDEAVIRRLTKEDTSRYAKLLISHAQVQHPTASPLCGGKLNRRIVRMLSYRKLSALATCGCLLLAVVCVIVLMTNRM